MRAQELLFSSGYMESILLDEFWPEDFRKALGWGKRGKMCSRTLVFEVLQELAANPLGPGPAPKATGSILFGRGGEGFPPPKKKNATPLGLTLRKAETLLEGGGSPQKTRHTPWLQLEPPARESADARRQRPLSRPFGPSATTTSPPTFVGILEKSGGAPRS